MNYDEFAFANQQLASMLKSGIPLEGAMQQLCSTMQRGELREELEKVRGDLAQGTPLRDAIAKRHFPQFYVRMMQIGAKSNDLPAMLTLLADYYQRKNFLWTRLKGLLIYPVIVLVASLALVIFLSCTFGIFARDIATTFGQGWGLAADGSRQVPMSALTLSILWPLCILSFVTIAFLVAITVPSLRDALRWRIVGFREASLSHFAASLQLLLKQGASLNEALGLLHQIEGNSSLGKEIARWQECLSSGRVKSSDLATNSRMIPPLFFWLVTGQEENWIAGLGRAAEIYYARAMHKVEMVLYAFLPVSILVLGTVIISELLPVMRVLTQIMNFGFSDS